MSQPTVKVSVPGVSLATLLTVLFVGLKLTHYIDWSWWWVLSPLWIPFAVVLALAGIILGGAFLIALIAAAFGK